MDSSYRSSLDLQRKNEINVNQTHKTKSHSLLNILCCFFPTDGEDDSYSNTIGSPLRKSLLRSEHKKEKTELVLLGNIPENLFSLVRITQKNFFVDFQQRKAQMKNQKLQKYQQISVPLDNVYRVSSQETNSLQIMYSLYDYGVKVDRSELDQSLPEKVVKYIASRCFYSESKIVVVGYSGSGNQAIQIAREELCDLVIAVDIDQEILTNTQHNSQIYGAYSKVQALQCNFLDLKLAFKPDLVVLSPKFNISQHFSLINHSVEDIESLLTKALTFSNNVIVVLPGNSCVEEVSSVFSYVLQKTNIQISKFEIQCVQIDGILSNYIVYLGNVSMTSNQDEFEFVTQSLLSDTQSQHLYYPMYQLLKRITDSVQFRDLLKALVRSMEKAKHQSSSILQAFLHDVKYHQLVEQKFIDQFNEHMEQQMMYQSSTPRIKDSHVSAATFNPKESIRDEKSLLVDHNNNSVLNPNTQLPKRPYYQSFANQESSEEVSFQKTRKHANLFAHLLTKDN